MSVLSRERRRERRQALARSIRHVDDERDLAAFPQWVLVASVFRCERCPATANRYMETVADCAAHDATVHGATDQRTDEPSNP